MENKNRRRFTRIDVRWVAELDFGLKKYKRYLDNLSLSGFHVDETFNQSVGDFCFIRLKQAGLYINAAITGLCSVSRNDHVGIALEFHSMRLDSFVSLQNSLLNKGVDTSVLGDEFFRNEIFDLDENVILFRPYSLEGRIISP
ncbi:MAG: PilZ domain-containing protein [Candidatus Electrothrix sp. AR4]|nr:PilZ domain-containing protein [Candidatus Electrothrix sp. AR4]